MAKNLVIVESPAKAKTIEGFLGKDFKVLSSFGHIRDLSHKDMGVDVSGGFIPIVKEVGVDGEGSPKRLLKGNPAFFAFQSHKAISIAAYAHGGILSSLPL